MYIMCKTFKWALPVAGGIYDQDPELLDHFMIILAEDSKHQDEEKKRRDRTTRSNPKGAARGPRRGRR